MISSAMMHNTAPKLDVEISEDVGKVIAIRGPHFDVRTAQGTFTARRAASCLLLPEIGDVVVLGLVTAGSCYLLSVLESAAARAELSFDGDVELSAHGGSVSVSASDAVRVTSPGDVTFAANRIELFASEANVVLESLKFLGKTVRVELERLKSVAGAIETVAERVVQIAKRSYRTVEGRDELRAGQIDYAADESLTVRARHASVTAEQLLKIDAEQIHIG
jgi:hypothetical protein